MTVMKEGLLEEIEKRVQDKVLEKTNGDLLKKLILNAESDRETIFIASLGTIYKRTGLHYDKRLERMDSSIHYFKKNEELSFRTDESKPINKLIIGDNYDALHNLLVEYRGKVDVVYIDPPYGKDSMGEFAQTNYDNAITRDNLLSMLYPRLVLARQLMSNEGVILCSIDDRNQAYLKCLFDEVFGESNFITCFPKKGSGGRQDSKHFAIIHEYVLCYARKADDFVSGRIPIEVKYRFYDEKKQLHYNLQLLRKWGDNSRKEDRPNLYYPIYYNEVSNLLALTRKSERDIEIYPMIDCEHPGCWRWGKLTMQEAFDDGLVEVRQKKDEYIPYEKLMEDPKDSSNKLYTSWIDDVDNSSGVRLLKTIIPGDVFKYPKAVDLLKKLIAMSTQKDDAVILDFYAGSGTTGHAVLDLNAVDWGRRTFILCQLNEKTDTTPNGIAYDVTCKRLKRIMTGCCYDGSSDFPWARDHQPYGGNLDVFEFGTVSNFEITEEKSPFDGIDETLYGQERFGSMREKVNWACSNFATTQKSLEAFEDWVKRVKGE